MAADRHKRGDLQRLASRQAVDGVICSARVAVDQEGTSVSILRRIFDTPSIVESHMMYNLKEESLPIIKSRNTMLNKKESIIRRMSHLRFDR